MLGATSVVGDAASWIYLNAQVTVTLAALIYLYLRHNRSFYFVRNMFMVAWAIALIGYARVPDRAAALLPRVGLRRQRRGLHRRRPVELERRERALQPVRRRAVDARRVRADDRRAARDAREDPARALVLDRVPARS